MRELVGSFLSLLDIDGPTWIGQGVLNLWIKVQATIVSIQIISILKRAIESPY